RRHPRRLAAAGRAVSAGGGAGFPVHVAGLAHDSLAGGRRGDRITPDGRLALRAPRRESPQRVDVIVYDVGVRIFLPASGDRVGEEIARTAALVDRIQGEIQR